MAIWAADVVGYSRLIEDDEAGTLAQLFALRARLVAPIIAEHGGRIFKTTGDGVLAEFGSTVGAVDAAVALQTALAARPERVSSLRLRIGVHVGEVVVADGDLYGDGVNLAARLEAVAEPGGIMLSDVAHAQLGTALTTEFADAGALDLKNISRHIRGFRWTGAPDVARRVSDRGAPDLIAVLPFQDLSPQAGRAFFVDGIVEDLITVLSRSPWFDVIARSSSDAAGRHAPDGVDAGRRLGARFVVEGSVRHAADRVRVTARLIDVATGRPRWSDRFDHVAVDLFELQDDLAQAIAAAIEPEFVAAWHRAGPPRGSMSTWELVMRGWSAIYRGAQSVEVMADARGQFERAVAEAPDNTLALGGLAFTLVNPWYQVGAERDLDRADDLARRAVGVDERDPFPWAILGYVQLIRGDLEAAARHLERALALNPSFATAAGWLAVTSAFAGDRAATDAAARRALELSPLDPTLHTAEVAQALACFIDAAYEESAEWARRSVERSPDNPPGYRLLAASRYHLGDHEGAVAAVEQLLALGPVTISWLRENLFAFGGDETQGRYLEALAASGVPD